MKDAIKPVGIAFFVLVVALSFALVGCIVTSTDKGYIEVDPPVIELMNASTVRWQPVPNAVGYMVNVQTTVYPYPNGVGAYNVYWNKEVGNVTSFDIKNMGPASDYHSIYIMGPPFNEGQEFRITVRSMSKNSMSGESNAVTWLRSAY